MILIFIQKGNDQTLIELLQSITVKLEIRVFIQIYVHYLSFYCNLVVYHYLSTLVIYVTDLPRGFASYLNESSETSCQWGLRRDTTTSQPQAIMFINII